jgi:hypothetical protein
MKTTGDAATRAFGELLLWQDEASWAATGEAMMAVPELQPFFTGIETPSVFALFTAYQTP